MTFRCQTLLFCLVGLVLAPVAWGQGEWMLLTREDGCVGVGILMRKERLDHVPASPDDFATMIRPHYPEVRVGLPDGFPSDMADRVVMVRYAEIRAPIFVRADVCRAMGSR